MKKAIVYQAIDTAGEVGFVIFGWTAVWACDNTAYPLSVGTPIISAVISLTLLGISRWAFYRAKVEELRDMQETTRRSRRQERGWRSD